MKSMRKLFQVPDFDDKEKDHAARFLWVFIFTAIVASVIIPPFFILISPTLSSRIIIGSSAILTLCIVLFFMMHYGYVRSAGIVLVTTLWAIFLALALTGTGVRAPIFIGGSLFSIFVAGLLVGNWLCYLFTVLSIVTSLAIAIAEINGLLIINSASLTPQVAWMVSSLFFSAAAFTQATTSQTIRKALARAHKELADHQKVEIEQQETLNLLTNVVNASPSLIFVKDTQMRTVLCNEEFALRFGKKPVELYGYTDIDNGIPEEIINGNPEKGIKGYKTDENEVLLGKTIHIPNESVSINGEKRLFDTLKRPLYDMDGQIIGILGVSHDVTEAMEARERERTLVSGLRGVIEAANELIHIQDMDRLYRRSVELAREKLGIERCGLFIVGPERKYLQGTYGTDSNGETSDEHNAQEFDHIKEDLSLPSQTPWSVRKDSPQTYWKSGQKELIGQGWVAVTILQSTRGPIGVMYNDGAISQTPVNETIQEAFAVYCSLLGSIIERKEAEAELLQHREDLERMVSRRTSALEASNKELESFTYTVSHDLRSPLRTIDGYSRVLLREYSQNLDEDAITYLKYVRNGAQQMGHLIDDLLALSRLGRQALKTQLISSQEMQAIIYEVFDELVKNAADENVDLKIGKIPSCEADLTLLRQIFINMISNSLKYSRMRDLIKIEVGSTITEHGLAYFVRDNGIGFDMRYASKLFNPFQRLHKPEDFEGTGVGLAIVRRLVERHGGKVWVDSQPEKGATFYFTIAENYLSKRTDEIENWNDSL